MAAGRKCVYNCQHPLWGGKGACSEQLDPADDKCLCDEGYVTTDAWGNPSCVLGRGLFGLYVSMALCGAAALGFLQWTAMEQRLLPAAAQSTRRAGLRLRLIRSASAVSASGLIIFCVAAAHGNLYTSGMLQALYNATLPLDVLAATHVMDLWVDTLPSRLVPLDGTAMWMINLAEKQNIFVWVGVVASISLMLIGFLAFTPALDTITFVRAINLIAGTTAACAVLCLNLVGFYLTGLIKTAMHNTGSSARAFYTQALRTLRMQMVALSVAAIVACACVVFLEPRLAGGARTPEIPISIMVLDSFAGLSLAVHFGKVGPTKGAISSRRRADPVSPATSRTATLPERSGPRAKLYGMVSYVRSSIWRDPAITTTQLISVRPRSTPGEKQILPTVEDES